MDRRTLETLETYGWIVQLVIALILIVLLVIDISNGLD